jgi:predicted alpha/beta hydrolase family esterase
VAPFLVLHGLAGSGPGHWQSWITGRLRAAGHDVRFPDLPDPLAPQRDAWLDALDGERVGGEIVLCHSLACILWLHHRAQGGADADRVLLVAPPSEEADVPEIANFFPAPLDAGLVSSAQLVCGDDDPYCPGGADAVYADLALPATVIPGGGHINGETGFGAWPALEAWCLDPRAPLGRPAYGANQGSDT